MYKGCKMKERIYVCHTYYHVYVSFLKEFALPESKRGQASIVLSSLSTDFEELPDRLGKAAFFEEVILFDEKRDTFFEELKPLKADRGNIAANMVNRIRFTKAYARLEEPYIPVDFSQYGDIYVFCDSDPIGYYLNKKKIHYHAMEDGIDCLKAYDAARYDNRGFFRFKAWMSAKNLIFIQNGYGKYCLDMEINDRTCLKYDCPKYKVVPRKPLEEAMKPEEKRLLIKVFIEDADRLLDQIGSRNESVQDALLLTEQLCSLEVRKQIFTDIIQKYCGGYRVFIKPHPRDEMDYEKAFPEHIVMKGRFPMEIMNLIEGVHFDRAIAVFTQAINTMDFVDEKIFLGEDFMDQYENPDVHRYNDKI